MPNESLLKVLRRDDVYRNTTIVLMCKIIVTTRMKINSTNNYTRIMYAETQYKLLNGEETDVMETTKIKLITNLTLDSIKYETNYGLVLF